MKHKSCLALLLALAFACVPEQVDKPGPQEPPVEPPVEQGDSLTAALWRSDFADSATVASASDVLYCKWMVDGVAQENYDKALRRPSADLRYEFVGEEYVRFVSEGDGYAVSLPRSLELEADYTIPKYAQKFVSEDVSLRITLERVTPYTPNEYYYGIYTGEWLSRYIANKTYVNSNGFSYFEQRVENDEQLLPGYSTTIYSINARGLDLPYYKIALVRPLGQWSKFAFIVMKAKNQKLIEHFDTVLHSLSIFSSYGTSKNCMPSQQALPNPDWNAETARYYQKLLDQKTFDFGVFSFSMCDDGDENLESVRSKIRARKEQLEGVFGRSYEIMPTYTHLGWYGTHHYFPVSLAEEFAGGDGFNGKPVLQFTYQITMNNNNVSAWNTTNVSTPMFGVLQGKYDSYFRTLASQIKAYGHPVLFRLNNEMNSDWTSYCGMMTLVDPEIFIEVWRHIYELFREEGVDNCIWIFNPIADSCPFSNWGEDLAYYPGNEYVQALGATNYVMGNSVPFNSFRSSYTQVFNENRAVFASMPWIISEFACGCGGASSGEECRFSAEQSQWVSDMFGDFADYEVHPYLAPFKGGVWFDCNDVDGDGNTVNYLRLDCQETLDAFASGFALMYGSKNF